MRNPIQIFPLAGLPEIEPGDDLARLIGDSLTAQNFRLESNDILVVAQKVVSKAEGRVVHLDTVVPSQRAVDWAKAWDKDSRAVELVLRESKRIVRMERSIIIAETRHGFVCANAGIDLSNAPAGTAILLPLDPDASAAAVKQKLDAAFQTSIGVICGHCSSCRCQCTSCGSSYLTAVCWC